MKVINLRNVLLRGGLTLSLLCGGMIVFATPGRTQVAGRTYEVEIKSASGNDKATVCFKFNDTNTLDITGLGPVITFGARAKDGNNNRWQAVTRYDFNPSVAFSGNERGAFGAGSTIDGDAINQNGNTYTFKGSRKDNCQPPANVVGGADGSILLQ